MQFKKQQKIILHVDDDEDDCQLLKESVWEHDGEIKVHDVNNGRAALLFLQQAKMNSVLPSLIILDLNMPVMDGKELLEELKKDSDLSSIPIVVFTTSSNPVDKEFASKYGAEFITKPPSIKQLSDTVKKLLYLLSVGYAIININFLWHIHR